MKLTAIDTIRISSAGRGKLAPGDEFEVSDHEGAELVKRGLANEVKGAAEPQNKEAPKPRNKGK